MRGGVQRLLADLALMAVAAVWGATFPVAKRILDQFPVFWYLAVRFAVACCVLAPVGWRDLSASPTRFWAWGILAGLALAAGYALQTLALLTSPATDAAFITGLFVVLTPVLASLVGRWPTRWEWLGVASGTTGLALLTGGPSEMGTAELLLVGCAVCFALHILVVDISARRLQPLAVGVLQLATVTVVMGGFAVTTESPPVAVAWEVWGAVGAMGVLASAVAFSVQSWAQRFTPPTHVALVFTAEPVAAALVARWWLGETLAPVQAAGAVLILAGIGLVQLRCNPAGTAVETPAGR